MTCYVYCCRHLRADSGGRDLRSAHSKPTVPVAQNTQFRTNPQEATKIVFAKVKVTSATRERST